MNSQLKAIAKIDVDDVEHHLQSEDLHGFLKEKHQSVCKGSQDSILRDSIISLSPSGDILTIANHKSLLILSAKWNAQDEDSIKTRYKVTWMGDICHNQSEQITAVICLPLLLPGKTSQAAHSPEHCSLDWTCIAVGFSSGHLRFYDEGGGLLLSEKIHEDPILFLKCQSYHPSRTSSYEDFPEELYVTFPSIVASIPGFALFQTLRACRNQLARVQANCGSMISPPPLALKKWEFRDQDKLKDCEVIGPSSTDMFDHLLTASICGGFSAHYRAGAPKSTLVISAGRGPFVGFHYALEGIETRSVLTDVALAVSSKFKGWLRGNKTSSDRTKEGAAVEAPEPMACRFGICDWGREANVIVRSPNRDYSTVTDTLGRIFLVNNSRGVVIRMWKGYREAQCGWLQVEEEEPSVKGQPKQPLRTVLFLVIYDPKKGLLEVWPVYGTRIAAFSCSKKGRLLYTSHGLVGLNSIAVKWANKSLSPCVFVDPEGTISEVVVPFHCALSGSPSERAADLSLLRKLKSLLHANDVDGEHLAQEVGLIASELKTVDARGQILSLLISNKYVTPDALEAALVVLIDKLSGMGEDPRRVEESEKSLLVSCRQLRSLTAFYKFVQQLREKPPNYSCVVSHDCSSNWQELCTSNAEIAALNSLSALIRSQASCHSTPRRQTRIKFKEGASKKSVFVDFLACFDHGKESSDNAAPLAVGLKKSLSPIKMHLLSELLFQGILYSDGLIEVWQAEAACSAILPLCLLETAIFFWLEHNIGKAVEKEMARFADIIKAICMLQEVQNENISCLWEIVRTMLKDSVKPFNALTAAITCRAVATHVDKHRKGKPQAADDSPEQDIGGASGSGGEGEGDSVLSEGGVGEWEDLSWDLAQWNLLIARLEDVAVLDSILSQNLGEMLQEVDETIVHRLPYEKPTVSLSSLLKKGKGSVSELVGKWLTASGLDPKLLSETPDVESIESSSRLMRSDEPAAEDKSEEYIREGTPVVTERGVEAEAEASGLSSVHTKVLDDVRLLRKHFPYSLSASSLLANMSWELVSKWFRAPDQLAVLDSAIACLQYVRCIHVRQGLSYLIWTSYLKQRYEIAIRITNESGGVPKDKLCRKELEMSDTQLLEFSNLILRFLQLFIETSNMSEVMRAPGPDAVVNRSEDLWDHEKLVGSRSLTNLALQQPQARFENLCLLLQLAQTTHIILSLNLRGQPLAPLFTLPEWSSCFTDFSRAVPADQNYTDPRVTSSRTQFLMRAVSGALQSVVSMNPAPMNDMSEDLRSNMGAAVQWMGCCQQLAYTWQISVDPLRRHQVCLLYSAGHDRLAEEILPAVNDLSTLASQLLLIAGQRLKLDLERSVDLTEKLANLDPTLTSWLFELNTQGVRSTSLADTALLAAQVLKHLPETHAEKLLAVELYAALKALQALPDDE